jgi:PBSX family phage terminase large subunit
MEETIETVETSSKYKPLFDILLIDEALENKARLTQYQLDYYNKLNLVDTVIATGGRGSGKSHTIAEWDEIATIDYDYKTLYTRFTGVSMADSVIPELLEKFENSNTSHLIKVVQNKIVSLCGSGMISFKGIKAGSNNQKANLKGLKGFNVQITDEAEEIPDKETFKKTYYSIRAKDNRNISILILNPASIDHWIFEEFFNSRGVDEGFNGIKDNVLYIHTSYLDVNIKYLAPNIIRDYERLKISHPDEYHHVVMGGWLRNIKGVLFNREEISRFKMANLNTENAVGKIGGIDVADEGTDSLSYPIGYIIGGKIYITDWIFTQENTNFTIPASASLTRAHKLDYLAIETNNHGSVFFKEVQKQISGTTLIPVNQRSQKHSRIIQNAGFVRDYFVFRDDYQAGSDYDKAMREMFGYTKSGKLESTKLNDDAPDSIALLSALARDYYSHLWY